MEKQKITVVAPVSGWQNAEVSAYDNSRRYIIGLKKPADKTSFVTITHIFDTENRKMVEEGDFDVQVLIRVS